MRGGEQDLAALTKRAAFLELDLPGDAPYCVSRAVFEAIPEREAELISFSILNICEERLADRRGGDAWERLAMLETLEDMKREVAELVESVCAAVETRKGTRTHEVVRDIARIVEEGHPGNLTIADIAAKVFLSQTYIRLLFKHETGETNMKLADVCFAIGYAEPSYFTKQFRKWTGMNPSDFRELYQKGKV